MILMFICFYMYLCQYIQIQYAIITSYAINSQLLLIKFFVFPHPLWLCNEPVIKHPNEFIPSYIIIKNVKNQKFSDAGTEGTRGATGPLIFGRSVNPISTKEGRLSPPIATGTPNVFHLPASLILKSKSYANASYTIIDPST